MTPTRLLACLVLSAFAATALAQQGGAPIPRTKLKLKEQGNLSEEERAKLDAKLQELAETRRKERAADIADMKAELATTEFELAKGDFRQINDGVFVRDLVVGDGPEAIFGDTIETHYVGWYLDGTKFDSSRDRDAMFPVVNVGKSGLIEAWDLGLIGMREGGKRLIMTASQYGYGKSDALNGVPGGTHLVYEIEALKVVQAPRRPDLAKLKLQKNASGLQWTDLSVGDGAPMEAGDVALVHYTGWFHEPYSETPFDSSWSIHQPFVVANVGNAPVIAGWNEGLLGMKEGGRRVLLIPPEIAYGDEGVKRVIPPKATLLFLVEAWSVFPDRPRTAEMALTKSDSGLQWFDTKKGEGREVIAGDDVTVRFTGWLENGQIFDSTCFKRRPIEVPGIGEAAVIDGWNEGLIGMRVGGERVLVVPSELAYGSRGAGVVVPPDTELTFVVEMVSAETPAAADEDRN